MSINKIDIRENEATGWEEPLLEAVRSLRFGSVEVVVHEGRVVQIERREKVRLEAHRRPPDGRRRNHEDDARTDRNPGGAAPPTEETHE